VVFVWGNTDIENKSYLSDFVLWKFAESLHIKEELFCLFTCSTFFKLAITVTFYFNSHFRHFTNYK